MFYFIILYLYTCMSRVEHAATKSPWAVQKYVQSWWAYKPTYTGGNLCNSPESYPTVISVAQITCLTLVVMVLLIPILTKVTSKLVRGATTCHSPKRKWSPMYWSMSHVREHNGHAVRIPRKETFGCAPWVLRMTILSFTQDSPTQKD